MGKAVLISIKPEFAEKIFNGYKTIELRKCMPNVVEDDIVIVYCTVPVKAIIGICRVKKIIKTTPYKLWKLYSKSLGIDHQRYLQYYNNSTVAIGIELTDITRLTEEITLTTIKQQLPFFSPPQTFKYFSRNEIIRHYKKLGMSSYSFVSI